MRAQRRRSPRLVEAARDELSIKNKGLLDYFWRARIFFLNQTRRTCQIGLELADRYGLGGRDALILANYIGGKVPVIYTHDGDLVSIQRVAWRSASLEIRDPLTL